MRTGPHPGCRVCAHESVDDVNTSIRSGATLEALAKRYKLTTSSLHRHRKAHLMPEGTSRVRLERFDRTDTLSRMEYLLKDSLEMLEAAKKRGNLSAWAIAVRDTRGTLGDIAKLRETLRGEETQQNWAAALIELVRCIIPEDILRVHARKHLAELRGQVYEGPDVPSFRSPALWNLIRRRLNLPEHALGKNTRKPSLALSKPNSQI